MIWTTVSIKFSTAILNVDELLINLFLFTVLSLFNKSSCNVLKLIFDLCETKRGLRLLPNDCMR
jgi:hypothetical protein